MITAWQSQQHERGIVSDLAINLGLERIKRQSQPMGERITYGNDRILVQYLNDRAFGGLEVSSPAQPDQWLSVCFLQDIYEQRSKRGQRSVSEQARFTQRHIDWITQALHPDQIATTQQQIRDYLLAASTRGSPAKRSRSKRVAAITLAPLLIAAALTLVLSA